MEWKIMLLPAVLLLIVTTPAGALRMADQHGCREAILYLSCPQNHYINITQIKSTFRIMCYSSLIDESCTTILDASFPEFNDIMNRCQILSDCMYTVNNVDIGRLCGPAISLGFSWNYTNYLSVGYECLTIEKFLPPPLFPEEVPMAAPLVTTPAPEPTTTEPAITTTPLAPTTTTTVPPVTTTPFVTTTPPEPTTRVEMTTTPPPVITTQPVQPPIPAVPVPAVPVPAVPVPGVPAPAPAVPGPAPAVPGPAVPAPAVPAPAVPMVPPPMLPTNPLPMPPAPQPPSIPAQIPPQDPGLEQAPPAVVPPQPPTADPPALPANPTVRNRPLSPVPQPPPPPPPSVDDTAAPVPAPAPVPPPFPPPPNRPTGPGTNTNGEQWVPAETEIIDSVRHPTNHDLPTNNDPVVDNIPVITDTEIPDPPPAMEPPTPDEEPGVPAGSPTNDAAAQAEETFGSGNIMIAIIIGAVALLLAVIALIIFISYKRRAPKKPAEKPKQAPYDPDTVYNLPPLEPFKRIRPTPGRTAADNEATYGVGDLCRSTVGLLTHPPEERPPSPPGHGTNPRPGAHGPGYPAYNQGPANQPPLPPIPQQQPPVQSQAGLRLSDYQTIAPPNENVYAAAYNAMSGQGVAMPTTPPGPGLGPLPVLPGATLPGAALSPASTAYAVGTPMAVPTPTPVPASIYNTGNMVANLPPLPFDDPQAPTAQKKETETKPFEYIYGTFLNEGFQEETGGATATTATTATTHGEEPAATDYATYGSKFFLNPYSPVEGGKIWDNPSAARNGAGIYEDKSIYQPCGGGGGNLANITEEDENARGKF